MSPRLRSVPKEPDTPTDITLLLRAEIESRDWDQVMIAGDKAKPIELIDRVKRIWRA